MLNNQELKPLIIIGGGGHASVLVDILRAQRRKILAIVSPEDISFRKVFSGIPHLKNDDDVLDYSPEIIKLINGVGMLPKSELKIKLNEHYISLGYKFETIISNDACVSPFSEIKQGAQIFAGAIIHAGSVIGEHSIINSGVIIEHDCNIGKYNHIAPRSILCGQVITGKNVYVGAGATVIQNITLEKDSIIGAGAIVTENVLNGQICYPSRMIIKR